MTGKAFKSLIERGDLAGLRSALDADPGLADRTIQWHLNQDNESDPLHYVCDCIGHGWLSNDRGGEITELLIAYGASINGSKGRESPLIAAASLGAEGAAQALMDAGADLEATSIFGSKALHWAAWMGLPQTVSRLIAAGAQLEARCSEFGATPLFWAVHGFGPNGPSQKKAQVEVARLLIDVGADPDTSNRQGISALEVASQCSVEDMYRLLESRLEP